MERNKALFYGYIACLGCIILLFGRRVPIFAAETNEEVSEESQVIRVGWYDYAGFYMIDQNGYRSGYGYDYLQEMARFGGWSYEYIYGTVTECMEMLEEGKIDLLASVMQSPEREKKMEFSTISMGKNFTVLTVRVDDLRYQIGNYKSFNGIHIGALKGDIRQKELKKYSGEHGFSYRITEYNTPDQIEEALKDKKVDAILTTNMRIASGQERIIAQFAPVNFYIVTKKGNNRMMKQIDAAMEQIVFIRKDFEAELSEKYFSVDMSGSLTFTNEEKKFISNNPVIQVVLPSLRRPMAYKVDNTYQGILVDILDEVAARVGFRFEYTQTNDQIGAIEYMTSGKADLLANVYNDYGWAEKNHLFLSRPYMKVDYVSVARIGENVSRPDLKVSAVLGYHFSHDYIENGFDSEQIIWYKNEEECIKAVQKGEADICFVNMYSANEYLQNYKYHNLYSSIISYSHEISVGVPTDRCQILLSLIDKGIASMGDAKINGIIVSNTMMQKYKLTIGELILRNPIPFILIFGFFCIVIVTLIAMLLNSKSIRKKNQELYRAKLAAERDSLTGLYNRSSFVLLVDEFLRQRCFPKLSAFVMIDIDNFKQINDTKGHSYGDQVLLSFAQSLTVLFQENEVLLCRMGGDEFSIFFPNVSSKKDMFLRLKEAQERIRIGFDDKIPVSCSVGVAFTLENESKFSMLYEMADSALYCAKRNGKGDVYVAGEEKNQLS